jgi:hypothetical protein
MRLTSCALWLFLLVASCGPAEWVEVRPEEAGFSIQMPAAPTERTQPVQTTAGSIPLQMYILEHENFSYMVSFSDLSGEALVSRTLEQMLDGARDGIAESIRGEILDESTISLDDHPGRYVVLRDSTGELTLQIRLLLVGKRLYQFGVGTPRGDRSSSAVTRFLDSFALLQN